MPSSGLWRGRVCTHKMFLKRCKKRNSHNIKLKSQKKAKSVGFSFPHKSKTKKFRCEPSAFTQLFLLVHVLGVRTAPASTLPVHLGLAGRHLVVSCLSTLPLGTEILPWLLDYIALPQGFVQFRWVSVFWPRSFNLVSPGETSKELRKGCPGDLKAFYPVCSSVWSSVIPPPPQEMRLKKEPILQESLGTDTIRSNEVLWTFHEQSTGLF